MIGGPRRGAFSKTGRSPFDASSSSSVAEGDEDRRRFADTLNVCCELFLVRAGDGWG